MSIILTVIASYFEAQKELENSIASLRAAYEKLDPSKPLTRVRLNATSSDLLAMSELCFSCFMECLPWSVHTMVQTWEINQNTPPLKEEAHLELMNYKNRLLNDGEPFSEDERTRYEYLNSIAEKHSVSMFSSFDREREIGLEKARQVSETKLKATVRAFLFSCRSYQDVMYALYLVATNHQPGPKSSMTKGVGNSQFLTLIQDKPSYKGWFEKMRYLRNLAKTGATCGVGLGKENIRVSYDDASNDKFVKVGINDFTFKDLSVSLSMSAYITNKIVSIE